MAETEELKKTKVSIEEMILEKYESSKSGCRLDLVCTTQIRNIKTSE